MLFLIRINYDGLFGFVLVRKYGKKKVGVLVITPIE
jgi:hypothetical protein